MINSVSNNSTINWLQLLSSTSKKANTTANSTGVTDSADISQISSSGRSRRKDPLEQLVNSGTITSDQASAIQNAMQTAMQSGQGPDSGIDPLAGLVSAGTITQSQSDSVKSAMQPPMPGNGPNGMMSNVLSNLVSAGTITQDQADSITQTPQKDRPQGPGGPPPMQGDSSQAAGKSTDSDDSTNLSGLSADEILKLLTSGKITEQQADKAIRKLEEEAASGSNSSGSTSQVRSNGFTNPLDSLVANGTITQDQEKSIVNALGQAANVSKAAQAYSAWMPSL